MAGCAANKIGMLYTGSVQVLLVSLNPGQVAGNFGVDSRIPRQGVRYTYLQQNS